MGQITARISDAAVEYRERAVKRLGLRKDAFDTRVYEEYMENHPLDADDDTEPPRKEHDD